MAPISHDHNFKNLFSDFPKEALNWLLPQAQQLYGGILGVNFLRQETQKNQLGEPHRVLDLPIEFIFERNKIILWLLEFQEDKQKFSIYKLLRYLADMMETYPDVLVIPTVLFTDRKKWRKDVDRLLESEYGGEKILFFKYQLIKLFDYNARDHYESDNPLVRILLPKMNYGPEERSEVIRRAYIGLFQLVSSGFFDKYVDFIDIYANIQEEEREHLLEKLQGHKETAMLAQYIRNQGKRQGIQQGMQQGIQQGETDLLCRQMAKKYNLAPEQIKLLIKPLSAQALLELGEMILEWDSYETVEAWIRRQSLKKGERK